ncbi:MAG: glycosyltransferase [Proteobacteria bacterium]|nr:glycosyltransferase [Pseudomonadota bacterium]
MTTNLPPEIAAAFDAANATALSGDWRAAAERYRALIAAAPDFPGAYVNLASVLLAGRDAEGAMLVAASAATRFPGFLPIYAVAGEAALQLGQPFAASNGFAAALSGGEDANLRAKLALSLQAQGRAAEAAANFALARRLAPNDAAIASAALFSSHYDPQISPAQALAEAATWPGPAIRASRPAPRDRDPERRLRVAYVSPDFANHSCAYFLAPLLAAHDRQAMEVFAYSDVGAPDGVTAAFKALDLRWRDMAGKSDDAFVAQAHEDDIDVLVDCAGHTTGNRLTAFARRPAPVQVTWLGYPASTGLDCFDARFVDDVTDPADALASENLLRVPGGFLAYLPPPFAPAPGPPPFEAAGRITFGSFNNLPKITPRIVAMWAQVLRAVPDSRLIVKAKGLDENATRERYAAMFQAHGIDGARVEFVGFVGDIAAHIARYRMVDVALDTFPYNGTTTTCEALWMGVPVVTLAGDRHAARVGASLLDRVGLGALVAVDPADFARIAAGLAGDRARLADLRGNLRARMTASPLCDGRRLAREFEAAYRGLWRRVVSADGML